MEKKDMVCIVCPIGCHLQVIKDESFETGYRVMGNNCIRGEEYGIREFTNPTRTITSTVKIKNAFLSRIPVRTNGGIPKEIIFECMKIINDIEIEAPIKIGEVIIKDILKTGVDVIASRSMERIYPL